MYGNRMRSMEEETKRCCRGEKIQLDAAKSESCDEASDGQCVMSDHYNN